ncbi:MAG TPA: hypothetical protein VGH32_07515 [Pirellulales bacterium]
MDSVELLEEAMRAVRQIGFEIREECLGVSGGGACVVHGRKMLFLDLNNSPRQRLDQVLAALRSDPKSGEVVMTTTLRRVLEATMPA